MNDGLELMSDEDGFCLPFSLLGEDGKPLVPDALFGGAVEFPFCLEPMQMPSATIFYMDLITKSP